MNDQIINQTTQSPILFINMSVIKFFTPVPHSIFFFPLYKDLVKQQPGFKRAIE